MPARKAGIDASESPAAPAPQTGDQAIAHPSIRRHTYREGPVLRPMICLVESTSDFLKAGTLAEVFRKFPALPPLIAVRAADESTLSFGDTGANELPMPFVGVHIEGLAGGFASEMRQTLDAFETILAEFKPSAVLAMGSGNAVLACSLLANKSGVPLARIGGGERSSTTGADSSVNAVLIDPRRGRLQHGNPAWMARSTGVAGDHCHDRLR